MPMITIPMGITDTTQLAVLAPRITQKQVQPASTQWSAGKIDVSGKSLGLINLLWRTNLAATLINYGVPHYAKYAKINPHLTEDGRYPHDFNLPKTVDQMKVLDSKYLFRTYSVVPSSTFQKIHTDCTYCLPFVTILVPIALPPWQHKSRNIDYILYISANKTLQQTANSTV